MFTPPDARLKMTTNLLFLPSKSPWLALKWVSGYSKAYFIFQLMEQYGWKANAALKQHCTSPNLRKKFGLSNRSEMAPRYSEWVMV